MSDLISRQAAIDALGDEPTVWDENDDYDVATRNQWRYDLECIKEVPTVDVPDRKVGEWIDEPVYKQTMDGKTWDGYTYCSECRDMHKYGYRSNYCPNCGARMDSNADS